MSKVYEIYKKGECGIYGITNNKSLISLFKNQRDLTKYKIKTKKIDVYYYDYIKNIRNKSLISDVIYDSYMDIDVNVAITIDESSEIDLIISKFMKNIDIVTGDINNIFNDKIQKSINILYNNIKVINSLYLNIDTMSLFIHNFL